LAFTPNEEVRRKLSLVWGATTFKVDKVKHTDEMIRQVDEIVLSSGKCRVGDEVVIVAGSPPGIPGSTNSLRVHRVGDAVHLAAPGYGN
jgi:pyruvate kinase